MTWLLRTFPTYFQTPQGQPIPLAPHHEELWRWIWGLRPGMAQPPLISILARGGGKSVSAELGSAVIGYFGLRRYGLYISANQSQADDHVTNVATAMEHLGIDRAVNKYGASRAWRISRLRTADGFTMDAYGLDAATRGVRIDEARPDLLIFDDVDEQHDTPLTIQKKILTLTRKILPTGTSRTAVLGVQNIPNKDGIFAQLADGRATFLMDRTVAGPYPALRDLPLQDWFTREDQPDGTVKLRLTGGTPVWAGQGLAECEALLTLIGPQSFLVEVQHRLDVLEGELFKRHWFPLVQDWPRAASLVRAWDFAGTEAKPGADPDWTVGTLMAMLGGRFWIVDMVRVRTTPKQVEDLVRQTAILDGPGVEIWLEQEGGSSGKTVIEDYRRRVLLGFPVYALHPTGDKLLRVKAISSAAEAGNVALVQAPWNETFLQEICLLGLPGVHDDIADTLSLAHHALTHQKRAGTWGMTD
jgi:predicted phage terminase large subunit-like protein